MPRRKARSIEPNAVWRHREGTGASAVTAIERPSHGCEIYLRFRCPDLVKRGKADPRTFHPTGLFARQSLAERAVESVLAEARTLAARKRLSLITGTPDAAREVVEDEVMTLKRGIDLSLVEDGNGRNNYVLDANGQAMLQPHDKAVRSRLRLFLELWDEAETQGRPQPTFNSFTNGDAAYIIRLMAKRHVLSGKKIYGSSVAVKMLQDVYAVAAWLRDEKRIGETQALPQKEWTSKTRAAWAKAVGDGETPNPHRPRHSQAELQALWSTLDDPRGVLARSMALGAHLHCIAAVRWSDLRLEATKKAPHGAIRYQESRHNVFARKLSARSRALLDDALTTGYLREYEAQRNAGVLRDYHLFPQGMLVDADGELPPALVPRTGGTVPISTKGATVLTIDPRLKLMLDIGAALRLGQVARLTRRAVDLNRTHETDFTSEGITIIGFAGVQGRGKKKSPGAVLNADQVASVRDALDGFLAPLEARFQAGEIADYPMCPGGRLKQGAVCVNNQSTRQPVANGAMNKWFKRLEEAAGVTTMPSRGWYGVRRLLTDEAPKVSANTKVLERVAGTSRRMLEQVYRDGESERVSVEASRVVGLLRSRGRRGASRVAAAPSVIALDPRLLKALAGHTPDEVRAALEYLHAQRAAESGTNLEPDLEPSKNRPTPDEESGGLSSESTTI